MANALGTYGNHVVHQDFYQFGNDAPLGQILISGVNTEAAVQVTDESDGVAALTTPANNGDTCVAGLNATFAPASNGPMMLEARVKIPSLAGQAAWVGFSAGQTSSAEVVASGSLEGSTTDAVGILFDHGVDPDQWNEYVATNSGETQQNLITEVVTADEWVTIRIEIEQDGTVLTYIGDEINASGVGLGSLRLIARRRQAVSPTALYFPRVYAASEDGTAGVLNVDYMHFEASRDWAVD